MIELGPKNILSYFLGIENIKNVNWLIREHPSEIRFNTKTNFTKIIKDIETKHSHIRLSPKNINPASLKSITDIALTSHGSVGLEYPSFGIPCIVSEKSFYTHCKFSTRPSNISEYKDLLKNINKVNKLNKKNIELAKIFLFIYLILARVRNSIAEHPSPPAPTTKTFADRIFF